MGAIPGAATGATIGYAGGEGTMRSILLDATLGAGIGAAAGASLGYADFQNYDSIFGKFSPPFLSIGQRTYPGPVPLLSVDFDAIFSSSVVAATYEAGATVGIGSAQYFQNHPDQFVQLVESIGIINIYSTTW
jgi:hypothetical protein